jgi:anti-sigma regulatory factor (Ser/Thr protein kinase)
VREILDSNLQSPSQARRFARTYAQRQSVEVQQSVELVVSELVANAVIHGQSPILFELESRDELIRVSVSDASHEGPRAKRESGLEAGGRGMQIIERLQRLPGWNGTQGTASGSGLTSRLGDMRATARGVS